MLLSVIGVLADLGYLGWDQEVIAGAEARARSLTAAAAANRPAGPAAPRRRARQRPAQILEEILGHRACAAQPGLAAPPWSKRCSACTTWSTTRSGRSARRATRPSRCQVADTSTCGYAGIQQASQKHCQKFPSRGQETKAVCKTGARPAKTQECKKLNIYRAHRVTGRVAMCDGQVTGEGGVGDGQGLCVIHGR